MGWQESLWGPIRLPEQSWLWWGEGRSTGQVTLAKVTGKWKDNGALINLPSIPWPAEWFVVPTILLPLSSHNQIHYLHIHTYIYIYTRAHMYVHLLHGYISLSQRQQDVEQVINTQIYTILQHKILLTIFKTVLYIIFTHKKFIYKVRVCI
jgi:hypothetical protein